MSVTTRQLLLPTTDDKLVAWQPALDPPSYPAPAGLPPTTRVAYAAAHIVADPLRTDVGRPVIDWDATLAFRRHLWTHGLGVAEAMDTAQRGMGLDWSVARELIIRSAAEARAMNGRIACGAGTDQLDEGHHSLDEIVAAYEEQIEVVEDARARVIVMASRALAAAARTADDYTLVYGRVLDQVHEPAILHWLGPMFDPHLAGYWGSGDIALAMDACLEIIATHADRVDGIKVSLLEKEWEIELRRRLPSGVRLYTGDDFNYPELILGDEQGWSDALLGIFDPIAPAASAALGALDAEDVTSYTEYLEPTLPLARAIFEEPTSYYKTGIVFLAWLAGHQPAFRMVGALESARSLPHLARLFRLADSAGLLPDRDLAEARMRLILEISGIDT